MIVFLTTHEHRRPIRDYLAAHGAALANVIVPMSYARLLRSRELPAAAYVFADVERLSDDERERAADVWSQLAARGCRLLNHPVRSMRRVELLRSLRERGANRFDVHELAAGVCEPRFPVFVRRANDHCGPRTPLLHGAAELAAAIASWLRSGESLAGSIVTEFCDTADANGVYRKYGAFRVGDRILPRHVFFSDAWKVKRWQLASDGFRAEELRYVETNPHERELREIFELARIQYGRIDYALADGRIQVWEINTNPMIVRPTAEQSAREAIHGAFARALEPAWKEIAAMPHAAAARIPIAGGTSWRTALAALLPGR